MRGPLITRRGALGTAAAATLIAATAPARAAAGADPLAGEALYADLIRYSGFGEKRTGTAADHAVSQWMAEGLEAAGLVPTMTPFTLRQFFPDAVYALIDGIYAEAFAIWEVTPTGPEGIEAPLALLESEGSLEGRIAVAVAEEGYTPPLFAQPGEAARRGAVGLIQITRNAPGKPFAYNARRTSPIPALILGSADEARTVDAARAGKTGRIAIVGRFEEAAYGYKVFAHRPGGPGHLVISTPTSAHSVAAGERGPGIAIFRALAKVLAARKGGPALTFVCPAGHEMQGAGIRSYLDTEAPPPASVSAWLHLGAGIACYAFEATPSGPRRLPVQQDTTRLIANREPFVRTLTTEFAGLPYAPEFSEEGRGYLGELFDRGYPAWGFEGGHAYYHLVNDLPFVTGPELLAPAARATLAAFDVIAGKAG